MPESRADWGLPLPYTTTPRRGGHADNEVKEVLSMQIVHRSRIWSGIFLAALLLSLLGSLPAPSPARASVAPHYDHEMQTPLNVDVSMTALPAVGEPAEVTIVVSSTERAGGVRVDVIASDGMRVDGKREFVIDLAAGESRKLGVRVTPETAGNHSVAANVSLDFGDGNVWGDSDAVFFSASDGAASASFTYEGDLMAGGASPGPGNTMRAPSEAFADGSMPAAKIDPNMEIPIDTGAPGGQDDEAGGDVAAAAGTLKIRGNVGMFDRNGHWKNQMLLVSLVSANGAVLTWTYSDFNGNFVFNVANPGVVRIRVWANYRHSSMNVGAIRVVGNGLQTPNRFSIAGWHYNLPPLGPFPNGEVNVGSWGPDSSWDGRRAWWIYQDLIDGFLSTWNTTPPGVPDGSRQPDGVTVEWQPGSLSGTFYFGFDRRVHLKDLDANSASTVLHEYGHAIMHNVYGVFMGNDCLNPHFINMAAGNRCSWSEGWPSFFALYVKWDPVFRYPCALPCTAPSSVNYETRQASASPYAWDTGERVEGNVTAALWDFVDAYADPLTEGLDETNSAITPFWKIWDVVYNHNHETFKDFWNHWAANVELSNSMATLYQNTIDLGWTALCGDWQSEPVDDSASLLLPAVNPADPPAQKALCTDKDVDFFSFDAVVGSTYVIETSDLGTAPDGSSADTTLTLYRMTQYGGLVQLAWDNNSGSQHLTSRIVYTPTIDGRYFVAVRQVGERGNHNYRYSLGVRLSGGNAAPKVTPPTQRLAEGQMLGNLAAGEYTVNVTANWTASDPDDGIASQDLQLQVDGGGFESLAPAMEATARSYDVPVTIGTTNRLQISATDHAGASSEFATGESFAVRGAQQTEFAYTGSWSSLSSTNAWGGAYARANGAPGVMAAHSFNGTGVALVGMQRPDGGRADVYVDGALIATVDFYSPAQLNRRVLFAVDGLSDGTHTLEVHWLEERDPSSSGYRLYLDGAIALD